MPERSALVMPCDESGSNMEAASPTASQAGPAAGSRTRDSGSAREQRAQGGGGADERGDVHGGDELGRPPGEIVEAVAKYPDRFLGFLGIDLEAIPEGLAEVREFAKARNIKGISIEPGSGKRPRWCDDPTRR